MKIEEIYSKEMFPGLIMGKPKDGMYDSDLSEIKTLLGDSLPIINTSAVKWTQLTEWDGKKMGYGSWGHLCGVKVQLSEDGEMYSFCIIFNYLPEKENLNEKIDKVISESNWKELSLKWNVEDL